MILVTVGNHPQPFSRLLRKIDELAGSKLITKIFAQTGYSDYQPVHYRYRNFVGFNTFTRLIEKSSFVITHAGAGTIINILSTGKPAVVVPRLSKYCEHTNDHQLDITQALEKQCKIIPVYDIELLEQAIMKARYFKTKKYNYQSTITEMLQQYTELWF